LEGAPSFEAESVQKNIRVAIAGVGNCASALVQGVEYYRNRRNAALDGVMRQTIGGYRCSDIEFVAAFDIDRRKVGRPLEEAIFAKPNCTRVFQSSLPVSNVVVQAGPVLDGVAPHMADYPDDVAFRSADLEPTDIATALRKSGADILVCYLPVGSEQAVKNYAQACLDAGVGWRQTPSGQGSFATRACRSSATISRARSGRPSSIGRWRGCSPTAGSVSIGLISSTPPATPISSTCSSGAA
jgi:hypothetical protein